MKAFVFAVIFTLFGVIVLAQKSKPSAISVYPDSEGIEILPKFPGGNKAFTKYIQKNLRWPAGAEYEGRVILNFVVEKDGRVSNVKVVKSLSPLYDAEALRVIKASPRWHPGRLLNGKNVKLVRLQQSVPVHFSPYND
jgi:protein TonB